MCKILWVDDDAATFKVGSLMLAEAAKRDRVGVQIDNAATMAEALDCAASYDCVLLDLGLPDSDVMHTVELLPVLSSQWPPIIVLSAFVYPDQDESKDDPAKRGLYWRVLRNGAENVFYKPMAIESPHLILDAIRKEVLKRIPKPWLAMEAA